MKLGTGIFGLLTLAVTLGPDAMGNSIRFDFKSAGGGSPLVSALFEDAGANGVRLTLTAPGLPANNSVQKLFFNLNPTMGPTALTITPIGSNGGVGSTLAADQDNFKTGGGGKYDLKLSFGNSPAFTTGDSLSFYINGIAGLTADEFFFLSTVTAGARENYAAVRIQMPLGFEIVPGDPSVTPNLHSVPDTASTAGLACLGLGSLALLGNRRRLWA
jgi:hypothetical protein